MQLVLYGMAQDGHESLINQVMNEQCKHR